MDEVQLALSKTGIFGTAALRLSAVVFIKERCLSYRDQP